jgi:hypothetical protein
MYVIPWSAHNRLAKIFPMLWNRQTLPVVLKHHAMKEYRGVELRVSLFLIFVYMAANDQLHARKKSLRWP